MNLGLPHKLQDQHRGAFPVGQHIGRTGGQLLGAWARGDAVETPDKALWNAARRAAADGKALLRTYAESLSEVDRAKLRPIREELINAAREADENLKGAAW